MTNKTEQLDLERLEALARAADPHGAVHLITHYRNSADTKAEEAWRQAATPAAMLALIALARRAPVPAQRPTDDELWDSTLRDRDNNQEWADKLAGAIAIHFGVDIGEHSNANCPWHEALEAIESAPPAAQPEGEAPQAEPSSLPLDVEFKRFGDTILQATTNGARLEALRGMAALFDKQAAQHAESGAVRAALEDLIEAIQFTPLGVRSLTSLARARAALAAQSQGAPASSLTTVPCPCCGESSIVGCDECDGQGRIIVDKNDLADLKRAQQAAAPGAQEARPHKIAELLRIYDEQGGDWCKIARAVESRYVDAHSAPGTPEAPTQRRVADMIRTPLTAADFSPESAQAGRKLMNAWNADAKTLGAQAAMRECPDCDGTGRISSKELCARCGHSGILPVRAAQPDGGQGEGNG